ncbi:YfdQ family protein [Providencia rustigianii]|uniref:YfdQ family protein n=1 Tax=Providencia rustigianii TaxID=158850 RepID=UPI0035F00A2A
MSQLNGDAISQITELAISGVRLNAVENMPCPAVAVPNGLEIVNLERYQNSRYRFRGSLKTTSINDFVKYSVGYSDALGVRCFIDAEDMTARTIFNLGTIEHPGHADNSALIVLKKTSPFSAVLSVNGRKQGQKELAEWLEDWRDHLLAFDADGNVLDIKQAIGAVRRITIESSRSSDHEDSDFSARRSVMENVEAKSKDIMPAAFEFKCTPYDELQERAIKLRYSILTSQDTPALVLRIVQLENLQELMAQEFRDILSAKFEETQIETFIGNFSA